MSDSSSNRSTPATPRVSKLGRLGSAKVDPNSPSRPSTEHSPRSVNSKPTLNRRSPKIITPPDVSKSSNVLANPVKQQRTLKGPDLQAQLAQVQDDLKKVKERLASEEEEKIRALEEIKQAKKAVEEANEKLEDALLSKKMAEESSELDKFRADELEQSSIESAQKREREWMQEIGNVRNQHAVDVASLVSAEQELQKVKRELVMATEAKNTALCRSNEAVKIAGSNVEKIEMLSAEVFRLKSLLYAENESHSKETEEMVKKFDSEVEILKHELGNAKVAEERLVDLEGLVDELKILVSTVKISESNALGLMDEWKKKAELQESQLEEVVLSEKEVKCSLHSVSKQLEECKIMYTHSKSEITSLESKIESLELNLARHEEDLTNSEQRLDLSKLEMVEMGKKAEFLKSEIQKMEKEKAEAMNNEKNAVLNIETLTQENNKLSIELEITLAELEKAKKGMQGLSSSLQEVSAEAREARERILIKQSQLNNAAADVEELRSVLKNTQEKNELVLDEAKYEIICLKKSIEKSETEVQDLRDEWDLKECNLISSIKKLEEESISIKLEKDKAVETFEKYKDEAGEEASKLLEKMIRAETELVTAKKSLEEEKAKSLNLKERLLDRENELQNITQENDELRIRDTSSLKKINELSDLLAELTSRRKENGDVRANEGTRELSITHREYDFLPVEEEVDEKTVEVLEKDTELVVIENANGNTEDNHISHGNGEEEEQAEDQLGEGFESIHKEHSSEREDNTEGVGDESDSKIVSSISDHLDGVNVKIEGRRLAIDEQQQQHRKKKKPLLHKFGSMLKKKSNTK
ncbi:WEB family protein [Platanthera guangdongensis]|uniref:WEB family protein n=1 Tax=Platanthera guangdongensis TaxID=2320717 RepID=A0ABR2LNR8_9ASPA